MSLSARTFLLPVLCLLISGISCHSPKSANDTLRIAAASSTQFALEEIIASFEEEHDIDCEIILGSSGQLTAQISEGAPFDIFISANAYYPFTLEVDRITPFKTKVFAHGKLVLWTFDDDLQPSLDDLTNDAVKHIAIADPIAAPYGRASMELLNHIELAEIIEEKLVYGESITQTNLFISSGNAEIGFTALSVVLAPENSGKGKMTILDDSLYAPIQHAYIQLNNGTAEPESIEAFISFLHSPLSKEILSKFGFEVPTN